MREAPKYAVLTNEKFSLFSAGPSIIFVLGLTPLFDSMTFLLSKIIVNEFLLTRVDFKTLIYLLATGHCRRISYL